jgi:hypothetical protein
MEPEAPAVAKLESLDQDKGCRLEYALDICSYLISRLATAYPDRVILKQGWVSDIDYSSSSKVAICF